MNIAKTLDMMTELIVHCTDPEEIVLFGSYAKGNTHPGSDLDLLIIGNFKASQWTRSRELKDLLNWSPIPLDLHLYTPEEMRMYAREPYAFPSTLRYSGVTLYKREAKRKDSRANPPKAF